MASGMEGGKRVPPEVLAKWHSRMGHWVWMLPHLGAHFEEGRIPPRRLCLAQGQGQMEFHLGEVSEAEEVVDLGWCGQEACTTVLYTSRVASHHILLASLFLKVLELLVDHGAKYPDDLGLLETGPQTQSRSSGL